MIILAVMRLPGCGGVGRAERLLAGEDGGLDY